MDKIWMILGMRIWEILKEAATFQGSGACCAQAITDFLAVLIYTRAERGARKFGSYFGRKSRDGRGFSSCEELG